MNYLRNSPQTAANTRHWLSAVFVSLDEQSVDARIAAALYDSIVGHVFGRIGWIRRVSVVRLRRVFAALAWAASAGAGFSGNNYRFILKKILLIINDCITFRQGLMLLLQNLPTHNWVDSHIGVLVAEAYRLKFTYADAPKHLDSKSWQLPSVGHTAIVAPLHSSTHQLNAATWNCGGLTTPSSNDPRSTNGVAKPKLTAASHFYRHHDQATTC